jgi:hypothetical protein
MQVRVEARMMPAAVVVGTLGIGYGRFVEPGVVFQ